ncbi:MAG: zinc-binding dehydrogenase [Ruminococcus sp.]
MIPKTMKAVVLTEPTQAENICLSDVSVPQSCPGWVLIKIRAFGLNHSEQILRLSEIQADYIQKPIIPGIECVGEVADPSDSSFHEGQSVVALMGGMGRSFGGTCALGYAAIRLAKALGCRVIATTHRERKMSLLKEADRIVLDTGILSGSFSGVTKALELVGPKTLRDTLCCVEEGGAVCSTGILGGVYSLNDFDPIKEIPNGVYLTGFFSNYPTQQTMTDIFSFLSSRQITPDVGAVYPFEAISEALFDMDHHKVDGKIVVKM